MGCGHAAPDAAPLPVAAAIGMGANLGRRRETLLAAWRDLHDCVGIHPLRLSSPYLSEPLGMSSGNWFVNAVALLETTLPAPELLQTLLRLEERHGRRRQPRQCGYQDRSLDLDLLFLGELCLHSDTLTLPHPRLSERLFVLAPLAELLPRWRHPHCGRSAEELHAHLLVQCGQKVRRCQWRDEKTP